MDIAELSMFLDSLGVGKGEQSQSEFEEAANAVKEMKNLDDAQKLQLYGLYKQSTVGDVTTDRPSMLDFAGAAKWDAWKGFTGMPKQNAAVSYIYIVNTLLKPDHPGSTSDLNDCGMSGGMGKIVSTLNSGEATQWNDSLKIFQAIEAEDLKSLKECLFIKDNNTDSKISDSEKSEKNEKSEKVLEHSAKSEADSKQLIQVLNLRDSSGLTPLLFAADRGLCQMAACLIESGADVDAVDGEGNSALMLCVVCEHVDIIELLIKKGANQDLINSYGESVHTMSDVSEEIKSLLQKK